MIEPKGLDLTFEEIKKFHKAFDHPISESPTLIEWDRAKARYDWIMEEAEEFMDAIYDKDIVESADALLDCIYFCVGTLVEMGIRPQKLFEIIQNANMTKLFPDGKPHYRDDGKVIKPDNWIDPHYLLYREIKNQQK